MELDQATREKFYVDVPFTKAADTADGVRVVGYASTWVKDRDGERVHPQAFDDTLEGYLSKNPIMLWQHNHNWPIGNVAKAEVDDSGLLIEGLVPPPAQGEEGWAVSAFSKVKAGIVRTFSIGGFFNRTLGKELSDGEEPDVVIDQVDLFEVSIVSVPSNPDSVFAAAAKAFAVNGRERTVSEGSHGKALEQVEQLLGVKSITDPDLATMSEEERRERFDELVASWPAELGYDDFRAVENVAVKDGSLVALPGVADLMDRLYHPRPELVKAGRVLSKNNEGKLRAARDKLDEVLKQVEEAPEVDEDQLRQKPPHLRTATDTKSCGTCVHWQPAKAANDPGICKLYQYATKRGQVCDSYKAKSAEGEERCLDDDATDALCAEIAEGKASVTDKPWDGSASRFDDTQWRRSCVLDRADCGDASGMSAKERYSLPVREPNGTLNRNGVHAAAGGRGVSRVNACSAAKKKAAGRLVRFYRGPLGEDPPESLTNLAG